MAYTATQGSKWAVKISSTWTLIPKWTKLSFEGGDASPVESTGVDDTTPTSEPGMPSVVSASYEINYDPANAAHVYLKTIRDSGAAADFRLALPGLPGTGGTAIRFDFTGKVSSHRPGEFAPNAMVKQVGALTISSGPTQATGAWDAA